MTTQVIAITTEEIPRIAKFAEPIWYQHYSPIIGEAQVKYMLEKFQSKKAILNQIDEGYLYYKVTHESKLVGYFSLQFRINHSLFISKFYLAENARGKGLGKSMLIYIEELAKSKQCQTIDLTVNKYNPAYNAYLKLGFVNQGSAEFDIGEGYIMDDYLMCKKVS